MRVTIKGITDSTITFNSIGIIIRGNSSNPELYPNSVARNIDIVNDEQMRELVTLKNAKLIDFIDESKIKVEDVPSTDDDSELTVVNNPLVENTESIIDGIEDMPTMAPESGLMDLIDTMTNDTPEIIDTAVDNNPEIVETTVTATVKEAKETKKTPETKETPEELVKPKRGKGRPKGSKNKKKAPKVVETDEESLTVETEKKAISPIKKLANVKEDPEDADSNIVVMTPDGPVGGEMKNSMVGEHEESEKTLASIEALKKLEEEENVPDEPIDESKFDENEQMGQEAVIASGESKSTKVPMQNSIIPEANEIKKRGVHFIDPDPDDFKKKEAVQDVKDATDDIFIDNDPFADIDDNDEFIEH